MDIHLHRDVILLFHCQIPTVHRPCPREHDFFDFTLLVLCSSSSYCCYWSRSRPPCSGLGCAILEGSSRAQAYRRLDKYTSKRLKYTSNIFSNLYREAWSKFLLGKDPMAWMSSCPIGVNRMDSKVNNPIPNSSESCLTELNELNRI